jgi:ketosteroid isomerase-like protein
MLHQVGRPAVFLLLGALLPGAALLAQSPGPGSDAAQVIAAEKAWEAAARAKDRKALEELTSPEFVQANWDGSRTTPRDQWLESLLTKLELQRMEISGHNAQVFGDTAVVTSRYAWEGKLAGQPFAAKGVLMDIWRQRDGRWQVVFRAVATDSPPPPKPAPAQ